VDIIRIWLTNASLRHVSRKELRGGGGSGQTLNPARKKNTSKRETTIKGGEINLCVGKKKGVSELLKNTWRPEDDGEEKRLQKEGTAKPPGTSDT